MSEADLTPRIQGRTKAALKDDGPPLFVTPKSSNTNNDSISTVAQLGRGTLAPTYGYRNLCDTNQDNVGGR
jgi:hypothetical protein